jgi:UDP-2-acetamido-3-amino-2,3-dideoxy-glucuronate N-acetyltransferase
VVNSSIHDRALCESSLVGPGTRVMAFAHIARDARLGRDCAIGEYAVVGEGAVLGDRVVVEPGVRLAAGVRLEDEVIVGANVTFAGGPTPTLVRTGAVIGAGATILAGLTVGPHARISEGAVVTRAVPPNAIVSGHPAQITGYVEAAGRAGQGPAAGETGVRTTRVTGVTLHRMREVEDLRGNLSVGELGRDVPFDVKRYFLV